MPTIIEEITSQLQSQKIFEKRVVEPEYVELVYFSKDKSTWEKTLENLFGPPIKPAGVLATKETRQKAESYGGLYENQTLYWSKTSTGEFIAMLWPWGDQEHITLKVAQSSNN